MLRFSGYNSFSSYGQWFNNMDELLSRLSTVRPATLHRMIQSGNRYIEFPIGGFHRSDFSERVTNILNNIREVRDPNVLGLEGVVFDKEGQYMMVVFELRSMPTRPGVTAMRGRYSR